MCFIRVNGNAYRGMGNRAMSIISLLVLFVITVGVLIIIYAILHEPKSVYYYQEYDNVYYVYQRKGNEVRLISRCPTRLAAQDKVNRLSNM